MRRLQLAGHRPLGLVGGSTGLIGDPKPTSERTLNSADTVAEWVGYLQGQVSRFLSFEGENAARLVNNLDWTAGLRSEEHTSELQSRPHLVCRLLLEKKKKKKNKKQ